MPGGLDGLKHIVVLMMSGRSFDHMLGGLKASDPRIDGLTGNESNPDSNGSLILVQPHADFQGQLDVAPDKHFSGVDLQIFGGIPPGPGRVPNMQGFVKSYFRQRQSIEHSHKIMNYFPPEKLPVLTALATEYAVFNGWFAAVPGPMIPNLLFAHYGTSFGQIDMRLPFVQNAISSIFERMLAAGHTAKLYYYDQQSSTMAPINLLKNQPRIFGTYSQFLADCRSGFLPDYCFIEPNHTDHLGTNGEVVPASDQHVDHHVQEGEWFIAGVYNAIRANPNLWKSTALLIVYDDHGGIYDHVVPPPCTPDGYVATADATGVGQPFAFDRLGVRVPAVLVSPWIPKGTVVPGARLFEHSSIPATVTSFFLSTNDQRTPREKSAQTFLDLLTGQMRPDDDCITFDLAG